jgi:hypothetical protein
MGEKVIEDGVKSPCLLCPYRTLSIIHRDRRCKNSIVCIIIDLPTCLHRAQSTCVFDFVALSFSLAFHESIANMYQVIDGFCDARLESAIRYRVKT